MGRVYEKKRKKRPADKVLTCAETNTLFDHFHKQFSLVARINCRLDELEDAFRSSEWGKMTPARRQSIRQTEQSIANVFDPIRSSTNSSRLSVGKSRQATHDVGTRLANGVLR